MSKLQRETIMWFGILAVLIVIAVYTVAHSFGFSMISPLQKRELHNKAEQAVEVNVTKRIGDEMNNLINIDRIAF